MQACNQCNTERESYRRVKKIASRVTMPLFLDVRAKSQVYPLGKSLTAVCICFAVMVMMMRIPNPSLYLFSLHHNSRACCKADSSNCSHLPQHTRGHLQRSRRGCRASLPCPCAASPTCEQTARVSLQTRLACRRYNSQLSSRMQQRQTDGECAFLALARWRVLQTDRQLSSRCDGPSLL